MDAFSFYVATGIYFGKEVSLGEVMPNWTDVFGWLQNIIGVGTVAGFVCFMARTAWQKMRELPVITYRVRRSIDKSGATTDQVVRFFVVNRGPDRVDDVWATIIAPDHITFGTNVRGTPIKRINSGPIKAYAPGAAEFPSASMASSIEGWGSGECKIVVELAISPKTFWMRFRRSRITLKLVSTEQTKVATAAIPTSERNS